MHTIDVTISDRPMMFVLSRLSFVLRNMLDSRIVLGNLCDNVHVQNESRLISRVDLL